MPPLSLPVPALTLSCLALVTLAAPACNRGSAPPSGALAVAQPQFDFGRVFEGAILEHQWELEVREPASLREPKTDCGCTLARIEHGDARDRTPYAPGQPLEAGESLFVSVHYDTRGRRGPAARSVTLTTASGEVLALTLAADVQPWLRIEPERFAFARVQEGESAEREFEVRAESGEAFGLSATGRALAPWVRVELEPIAAESGRARLWKGRVVLDGSAPQGTFSYPIELVSDVVIETVEIQSGEIEPGRSASEPTSAGSSAPRTHSTSPSWTLQVAGPLALSAPTLEFGVVLPRETVARSVRLESLRPDFVPEGVKARLEPLRPEETFYLARTAQVRTRLVGGACEIELVLAGLDDGVTGNFLARLVVETGYPAQPHLEAIVRGVRAPDGGPPR